MSVTKRQTLDLLSHDVEQTQRWGKQLGALLRPGDVICLSGNLGAGKTALTCGIGAGWEAHEPITSPTFTLIHEHQRQGDATKLYHVDCYRLQNADDAWNIGLDDILHGDGIVVIEWPEHIAEALPVTRLWITLTILEDTQRSLTLEATGERYRDLLAAFHSQLTAP